MILALLTILSIVAIIYFHAAVVTIFDRSYLSLETEMSNRMDTLAGSSRSRLEVIDYLILGFFLIIAPYVMGGAAIVLWAVFNDPLMAIFCIFLSAGSIYMSVRQILDNHQAKGEV
jgi:hypothetical protein